MSVPLNENFNLLLALFKTVHTVKIVTSADEPLYSLKLIIFKDEDVLQEIAVDKDQLDAAIEQDLEANNGETKERAQVAQFGMVFSPMQLTEPCTIRVRAQTESGELRGIGLNINKTQSV